MSAEEPRFDWEVAGLPIVMLAGSVLLLALTVLVRVVSFFLAVIATADG